MFNKIDDIRKAMHDFRINHGRCPNIIFISKEKRKDFIEMIYNSFIMDEHSTGRFYPYGFGDITICGVKVRWTESIDGVDYIEEFDDIYQQKYEYLNKVLKPLTSYQKNKRRKIIL